MHQQVTCKVWLSKLNCGPRLAKGIAEYGMHKELDTCTTFITLEDSPEKQGGVDGANSYIAKKVIKNWIQMSKSCNLA